MKITDKKNLAIIIPAIALIVIIGLLVSGKRNDQSDKARHKSDRFTSLFSFMTFAPDDETTLPLDPSKIETYEIEEEKFIKRVVLEKDPVCVGEDFMVTVEATNPNGPDSNLVVRIGNKPGNPAVLRFTRAGEREFYVVVRDEGKRIEHRKVTIDVRDCGEAPLVYLKAGLHSTRPETAEFEVADKRGFSGECAYDWEFGDGTRQKTATGYATHHYGMREQSEFLSTFIAKVTVTDSKKNRAVGRASISFPNIHYVSKMMGSPIIPVIYNRFPVLAGGRYETTITMKNIFDDPIIFDEAQLEFRPCDPSAAPAFKTVGAASVISQTSIAGKSAVEDRLVVHHSALPGTTCNIIVKLVGRMPGNNPVSASIYLDIPPKGPVGGGDGEEKGARVTVDKEMQEKLNKAAQILGKDRPITPDDIKRLEKEGKL